MRQYTALFLVVLVLGGNAAQVKQQQSAFDKEIKDKNSQFYELLENSSPSYVVDEVLSLLKNLEDAAKKDLSDLKAAWAKQKALLESALAKATAAYNKQVYQCNRLEKQQHYLENQIAIRVAETERNNRQIAKDHDLVKVLLKEKCAATEIYIDHIVDHRDALNLFQVLLKAIDNYQPGSFAEVQKVHNIAASLRDYINVYAEQHSDEFNQILAAMRQVEASGSAGDEEVNSNSNIKQTVAEQKVRKFSARKSFGTAGRVVNKDSGAGSVDNKKGQITLDNLDQKTVRALAAVKGQLKRLLNKLITTEQKKQENDANSEAEASLAAATVKKQLQDEQRRLTRRNEVLADQIAALKVKLAAKIAKVKACRELERQLLAAKNQAQKNLNDATARFEARRAVLEEEIKLFSSLYIYYRERVYNVATSADRSRVQDYADNGNFKKSGSYTAKSASAYNSYRGNVASSFHKQAESNVQ